ncbi:MAG: hypothetical protein AAF670_04955, partial [Planctomycetota bacterium]
MRHELAPRDASAASFFDPSSDYLMVCGQWSGFLLTAVERSSGYLVIRKVQDKRSSTVNASIIRIFEDIDRSKIKTLTFDNGPESYDPEPLERAFHCRTYFCDP